ncbi:hypothetical protein TCAL_03343 [Tigriopus californicus]|uniref:Sm domain-containing protein n=1 Tax=Tigriopus californicus TaxID=6832 RepID=A0A553P7E5_TIGCA|nr:U7 snRNA-associated Sm-like protein LSm10 [Tigriopus californicus]TRY73593.1 hypothetical protein TCAL_03343 [Tigriopus californicus]
MSSGQESFLKFNTLSCVAGLCVNHVTTVELRNDSHVTGLVKEVDGFMNVVMDDVEFVDPRHNRMKFSTFFVQNRLVRYIHIPKEIDIVAALPKVLERRKRTKGPPDPSDPAQKLSGARKKIMKIREQRRNEDLINAMKMCENKDAAK